MACPRYVATNAPTMSRIVVSMKPRGSLSPGGDELSDDARNKADKDDLKNVHVLILPDRVQELSLLLHDVAV
jgi:hypothetical protein